MNDKLAKDLMVPVAEYPTVAEEKTLLDAVLAIDEAHRRLPEGRQPYRAALVVDRNGKIIGKVGQLSFLKALEPQHNVLGEMEKITVAGVSSEFISKVMDHFRFFQDDLTDLCARATNVTLRDAMSPVTESIDENAPLGEAIYKIVTWQTLSILVKRGDEVVGLLRLSDLFEEVSRQMRETMA